MAGALGSCVGAGVCHCWCCSGGKHPESDVTVTEISTKNVAYIQHKAYNTAYCTQLINGL